MVGVYTAQRISDNNIRKEDIHTSKRWIEYITNPDNHGKNKAIIMTKDLTYIDIKQKKTGAKVSIPCKKELVNILKKYSALRRPDHQPPHQTDSRACRPLRPRDH